MKRPWAVALLIVLALLVFLLGVVGPTLSLVAGTPGGVVVLGHPFKVRSETDSWSFLPRDTRLWGWAGKIFHPSWHRPDEQWLCLGYISFRWRVLSAKR
jgi:hypothetical protein